MAVHREPRDRDARRIHKRRADDARPGIAILRQVVMVMLNWELCGVKPFSLPAEYRANTLPFSPSI